MLKESVQREWISYADAERYSGLSHTTIWRRVVNGEIKTARVGRSVRIHLRRHDQGRARAMVSHCRGHPALPASRRTYPLATQKAGSVMKPNLYCLPEELRQRHQWVVHKDDKVPYIAGGVGKASSTDSLTWRSFEEAVRALEIGKYDGLGFVFSSGDPFAGVDLDDCRDPETGALEECAEKIVEDFGSYAEVSQSGKGVHIIIKGKAPNKKRGKVEAYSSERFFAMKGWVL